MTWVNVRADGRALYSRASSRRTTSRLPGLRAQALHGQRRHDPFPIPLPPLVDNTRKNVTLLSISQALLLTNNSILIATNGLAGYALATDKTLATLPVTAYIAGAALSTMPASLLMRRIGRRSGFTLGALFGMAGALICAYAAFRHQFWLLCAGALVLGVYNATGQYYRFAAADSASADFKSKAISLVMAGGIAGGILGPETTKLTKDWIAQATFAGSYLSLALFCLMSIGVLSLLRIPALSAAQQTEPGRPLALIARQPQFLVAVISAVVAFGVMNLLMTATPLAMDACRLPFSDAAFVIQWHVIAMFAPSFFTGALIKRFGLLNIMLLGVVLSLACVGVALAGVDIHNFWLALVLIGVGWNFMFVGATTLLTECHTPAERGKVQGVNDLAIFATMIATSLSSGLLFTLQGWMAMNRMAIPFLLLAGGAIVWLGAKRRRLARASLRGGE
ncbi:MAG: MFS transporter [Burkholderiales bacterium]|nr:MFS transporter [Burkholderiales bacterium]